MNGADVRAVTRQSLRRQVGIVEQNPQLFGGTIASNLRWGAQDAGDDDLMAVIGTAQAADVVASKDEGLG